MMKLNEIGPHGQGDRDGDARGWSWSRLREGPKDRRHEGVEWPETIAPDDYAPAPEVLHRETVWVKFNRTLIFNGELTNGNKILD
jgi:hypothetical protein